MRSWLDTRAIQRTGLMALLVAALLPTSVAQESEKLPPAKQVIERSIEALGGRAAFEKLTSQVVKGTFEIAEVGLKGPMVSYTAPVCRQYTQIELPGYGVMQSGSDGTVFWKIDPMMGPQIIEGTERALQQRNARFNSALYWEELFEKAECVGIEEVEGQPCYKVVFTPKVGEPEVTFYDRNRYIPVKMVFRLKSQQGGMTVEVFPSDYKRVDGVMASHTQKQVVAGGLQTLNIKTESIEHNVDIPADRFALPEAIVKLLEEKKAEPKQGAAEKTEK